MKYSDDGIVRDVSIKVYWPMLIDTFSEPHNREANLQPCSTGDRVGANCDRVSGSYNKTMAEIQWVLLTFSGTV